MRFLFSLGLFSLLTCGSVAVASATPEAQSTVTGGGTISGSVAVQQARVHTTDPKGGKEVVVYLEPLAAGTLPAAPTTVSMDQKGLVFIPHVLPVFLGTTVEFLNNDTVEHNVYLLDEQSGKTQDLGTWPQGVSVKHRFDVPGAVIILCKLHLEMAAYVVVLETPWFTTAMLEEDRQRADFKFEHIPPGNYRVHAWHKKLRLKQPPPQVTVTPGEEISTDLVITKPKYAQ